MAEFQYWDADFKCWCTARDEATAKAAATAAAPEAIWMWSDTLRAYSVMGKGQGKGQGKGPEGGKGQGAMAWAPPPPPPPAWLTPEAMVPPEPPVEPVPMAKAMPPAGPLPFPPVARFRDQLNPNQMELFMGNLPPECDEDRLRHVLHDVLGVHLVHVFQFPQPRSGQRSFNVCPADQGQMRKLVLEVHGHLSFAQCMFG